MATRRAPVIGVTGALLVVLVLVAGWSAGASEEAIRIVVRGTAQGAVLLFAAAFSASSLRVFWRSEATRWLMLNRRRIGLSFALAHTVHLGALVALGLAYPTPFVDELNAFVLLGGGLAYVLMFAMAATSNDASVRRLGIHRWRTLHTLGSWYIWIVFAQSYLPRAIVEPAYIPYALLVMAVPCFRVARFLRRRSGAAARPTLGQTPPA